MQARKFLMDVVPEACSNKAGAPNPEEVRSHDLRGFQSQFS